MELDQLLRVAAGAIGGLAALWGAWSKLWVGRLQPMLRRRRALHNITANAVVFNRTSVALATWRVKTGAMRGLCLSAKNCGSHWDPQKPVSIGVIAEAHADRVPRVFTRWDNQIADPPYRALLGDVISAGERGVLITTDSMPESVLADYYRDQGVVASVVFQVAVTAEAELIYVSLNFGQPRKDGEPLTDEQVHEHVELARSLHRNPEAVRKMAVEGERIWGRQ